MFSIVSPEEARRLLSSKRKPRQRRRREGDDVGAVGTYKVVRLAPKKPRVSLRVPTESEQAALLETAVEKELQSRGLNEVRIRHEKREYEGIFTRHRARHLHALNPYAGAGWASFLEEAIGRSKIDERLWFVTIIDDDWILGTYPLGPDNTDLYRPRFVRHRFKPYAARAAGGSC
ncbi:hypothetical protein, partial [Methylobacterium oryzisoli]